MALQVPKTRMGKLPINIEALMKKAQAHGFLDELSKLAVSDDEAIEAAKELSINPKSRAKAYADSTMVGGTLAPAIDAIGRMGKAVGDAKGGKRLAAGRAAIKAMTGGDVLKSALVGGLGGTSVQAGREGVSFQHAKKTYKKFMAERGASTS